MRWPRTWEDELTKARIAERDTSEYECVYINKLRETPFDRKTAWDVLASVTTRSRGNRNPLRMLAWSKDFVYFLATDSTGDAYIDSVPRNPP